MCKVFYIPGDTAVIDYAREVAPDQFIAQHSGLMLAELRVRFPGAILGDEDDFLIDQQRAFGSAPVPVSQARFEYLLSQRQVLDLHADSAGTSYKLDTDEPGNMSTVYAQCAGHCWSFRGLATLPHLFIMQSIAEHAARTTAGGVQ